MKQDEFNRFLDAHKNYETLKQEVNDSVGHIIGHIFNQRAWWDYNTTADSDPRRKREYGNISLVDNDRFIQICVDATHNVDVLYHNEVVCLNNLIPTEWLYVADFEGEFLKCRQALFDTEAHKERVAREKNKLIASAKKKLSEDELIALGIK